MCPGTATRSGNCPPERPSVFGQRTARFLYAQAVAGITGRLGRIANVTRQDTAALSREVPLDLAAIQEAWPAFESGFDSLHGRRMMGLIDNRAGTYRLCTERLPRDIENPLGLDETTIPGGRYLRLRLIGDAPGVYGQIAAAFDELFENAEHDPTRPLIEFYRHEGEVDCLVPVNAAVLSPEHSSGIKELSSRRHDPLVLVRRQAHMRERAVPRHARNVRARQTK